MPSAPVDVVVPSSCPRWKGNEVILDRAQVLVGEYPDVEAVGTVWSRCGPMKVAAIRDGPHSLTLEAALACATYPTDSLSPPLFAHIALIFS